MKTLALALAALFATAAHAQYTVQHNGVTQFSAATLDIAGSTWNFVDGVTPPPVGGNYIRGVVRYDGPQGRSYQVDFSELGNLFGRYPNAQPTAPMAAAWPYASGSQPTLIQAARGAIVRSHFHTPATVAPVTFRGPYQALQPVEITVSGPGLVGVCTKTIHANAVDQFKVTTVPTATPPRVPPPPNLGDCNVLPNSDYVFQMSAPACTAAVCAVGLQANH